MEVQFLIDATVKAVYQIAANQNVNVTNELRERLKARMQETYKAKFSAILLEVQKDAREADFLGQGYKNGKIPAMSMHAGKISLQHGIVMYAKELLQECTTVNA